MEDYADREFVETQRPLVYRQRHRIRDKLQLIRGKVLRFYVGHFRKEYVTERLALRKGSCKRCGACCRLLFKCLYAAECNGATSCRIYKKRPVNCRIFPLNAAHLAERDLLMPDRACGYYFEEREHRAKTRKKLGDARKTQ